MTERPPIPACVVGGWLGAGKTTLLNRLLRDASGRRIAVLVNDFGALPIDRDLVVGAEGDLLDISGGCVCCAYGSELVDTLLALPARRPDIDLVAIETSGVALPGMVASAVQLLPAYRMDAVVVVADAETIRRHAADEYLCDTVTRQLAAADLVLLNRCDLVDAAERALVEAWLRQEVPAAVIVPTERCAVPAELVLGTVRRRTGTGRLLAPGAVDADRMFETRALRLDGPVDVEALGRTLAAAGLLRAKGLVCDKGGRLRALQVWGRRYAVDEAIDAVPSSGEAGAIVMIARRAPDFAWPPVDGT